MIKSSPEPSNDPDIGCPPITIDNHLQIDFALDAASATLFGVVRTDLPDEPGRLNAASGPERPAADASAGPITESGSRSRS